MITPLRPKALIITGDLADSKTRESRGQQFEEEWQVLRRETSSALAPPEDMPACCYSAHEYKCDVNCCEIEQMCPTSEVSWNWCRVQAYRNVLDDVVATAGLPESAILDVRGNHDVYDVPAR